MKKYTTVVEAMIGDSILLDSAFLEKCPTLGQIRQDYYQAYLEMSRADSSLIPEDVSNLFQPTDYFVPRYEYPGMDYQTERILDNPLWFNQEMVQKLNARAQEYGHPYAEPDTVGVVSIDLRADIDFLIVRCDAILHQAVVKQKGTEILRMTIEKLTEDPRGLPSVLLVFDGGNLTHVECAGEKEELLSRGFQIASQIPVIYERVHQ